MLKKLKIWFIQYEIKAWDKRLMSTSGSEALVILREQMQRNARIKELQNG